MIYSPAKRYELFSKCEWREIARLNEEVESKSHTSWQSEDVRSLLDSAIARYFLSREEGPAVDKERIFSLLSFLEIEGVTDPVLRLDAEKLLCHLDPDRVQTLWVDEESPKKDALREFLGHAAESGCDSCFVFKNDSPIAFYSSRSFTGRSNVHSTTKSVVGLAVLMLHDRGILDLKTPVVDLLPDSWREEGEWNTSPKREITVLHLLTHTSGLVEALDSAPGRYTQRTARRTLSERGPAKFGGGYKEFVLYSNFGVQLLGAVMSGVTGELPGEHIRREIFAPLGMKNTTLREAGDEHVIHGDMFSTPQDLGTLGAMIISKGSLFGHTFLSPSAIDLMLKPDREYFEPSPDEGEMERCCLWYRYPQSGVVATSGDYGNDIYLLPEEQLVVVRTHDWPPRPTGSCLQKIHLLKS